VTKGNYLDGNLTDKMMSCRLNTTNTQTNACMQLNQGPIRVKSFPAVMPVAMMWLPPSNDINDCRLRPLLSTLATGSIATAWQHPMYQPFGKIHLKRRNSLISSR
jgi:hypothetical protein